MPIFNFLKNTDLKYRHYLILNSISKKLLTKSLKNSRKTFIISAKEILNHTLFGYIFLELLKETTPRVLFFLNLIVQSFFLSMLSKHVEHNKCPFFLQNVFVDLSISFLHIKHLKIGDIQIIIQNKSFPSDF